MAIVLMKRSIKSLRYAQASFFIAMLALVVSMPCISVWYSNRYAYSTLDTLQYNVLVKKLNAIGREGTTTDANIDTQKDSIKLHSK